MLYCAVLCCVVFDCVRLPGVGWWYLKTPPGRAIVVPRPRNNLKFKGRLIHPVQRADGTLIGEADGEAGWYGSG